MLRLLDWRGYLLSLYLKRPRRLVEEVVYKCLSFPYRVLEEANDGELLYIQEEANDIMLQRR